MPALRASEVQNIFFIVSGLAQPIKTAAARGCVSDCISSARAKGAGAAPDVSQIIQANVVRTKGAASARPHRAEQWFDGRLNSSRNFESA